MTAKLDLLARVVLRPGQWSDRFNDFARKIPHDEPGNFAEFLRKKVEIGTAKVAEIRTDSGVVGFAVYSVVPMHGAQEFVLIAAFGRDHRDLTAELSPQIDLLARSLGCVSVRFHTMRPGAVSKGIAAGYHVSEIILRKHLSQ